MLFGAFHQRRPHSPVLLRAQSDWLRERSAFSVQPTTRHGQLRVRVEMLSFLISAKPCEKREQQMNSTYTKALKTYA